jgi:hypothetical protein
MQKEPRTATGFGGMLKDDDWHGKMLLRKIEELQLLRQVPGSTITLAIEEYEGILIEKLGLWQLVKAERRRLDDLLSLMPVPQIIATAPRAWKDAAKEKPSGPDEVVGLTIYDEIVAVIWDSAAWIDSDTRRGYSIRAWLDPRPYPKKEGADAGSQD